MLASKGPGNETRNIIATMSLTDDMQLNKAKRAWKPSSKDPRHRPEAVEENDPEEAETQLLFRRVRSILNKITPQMFQQLMKQVTELTVDTEERLKGVIDLIFEKAISEPILSVAYANMCRFLMGLKVPTTDGVVNFRKLLLNRCQKEFEKDKDDDKIFEKKQKELDAALGEEEKQWLKEELDDSKDMARRRSLGNIKFLGELFKLKMLTGVIMHDCIVKLLKNKDKAKDSLEGLCILLTTTGKDLDVVKAKPRMDQYFSQLEVIIKEKKTSFKVRFMLQDVLDLRRHNWVPRRGDQGPTTIVRPFPGSVLGSRPATRTLNRFSALQLSLPSSDSSPDYTEEERLDDIIRGRGHRFDRRDDRQDNRRDDRREDRRDFRNRQAVTKHGFRQEESSCKSDRRTPVHPVCRVPRATTIIEEYLHVMEEAVQCAQEMNRAQQLFVFVRNGLESTLERSAIDREHMGLLLHQLIKTGMMPTQQYYKGLQEILEVAEDMAIDIPLFWLYLAELITPMLYEGGIPMGQLFKEISKSLVPLGKASDLLVHILILLRKGMGHIKVGAMWKEAGLSWQDFLPEDEDVTGFVTLKKVEFTLGDESERGKKEEVSATEISKRLDRPCPRNPEVGLRRIETPVLDFNNQLLAPGSKGMWGSWGKIRTTATTKRAGPGRSSFLAAPTPPPPPPRPPTPTKPALTEEELEKKSTAIVEEYLHINDMKEAVQCVQEMNSAQRLFVFVRNGLESTLERSAIHRERMGLLLHQLIKTGMMPTQQYYKGLQGILEVAEDMAMDIPLFWLYLAELITPMLHEGGIPMGQLFKEISKPLVPLGKAGDLLVNILILLCKEMGHTKVRAMWKEAGLSWKDFLPEDEDITKFVTLKKVEFTLGDESERGKKEEVSATEMSKQLDRLIQDKADNGRIFDWIEANLEEEQTSSNAFVRALVTCICRSAIICGNPYKVDSEKINHRAKLLQKYLKDEQKELQALYALQALVVEMEQPAYLLRMFFDILYDEDLIKEEVFFEWESSKDPAEQQGKGMALKSATAFFIWLREDSS